MAADWAVTSFSLSGGVPDGACGDRIRMVYGDIYRAESAAEAAQDASVVTHLAAVDHRGRHAHHLQGLTSSVAVDCDRVQTDVCSEDQALSLGRAGRAKQAQKAIARRRRQSSGVA